MKDDSIDDINNSELNLFKNYFLGVMYGEELKLNLIQNKTTGFPPFFQTFERNNSIRSNNVVQLIGSENLLIFDDSYGKMVDDEKENTKNHWFGK